MYLTCANVVLSQDLICLVFTSSLILSRGEKIRLQIFFKLDKPTHIWIKSQILSFNFWLNFFSRNLRHYGAFFIFKKYIWNCKQWFCFNTFTIQSKYCLLKFSVKWKNVFIVANLVSSWTVKKASPHYFILNIYL